MKAIAGLIFCALILPAAVAQEKAETPLDPLYVIQPNDLLEIFVWKEPDLTREVLVRPDGRVSFPLVQDLQAAGITPPELKKAVESRLSQFLTTPEVTIIVKAIQSYKIYVLGKVQTPGGISVPKAVTVLQALALAGGFADYAKEQEMKIIRSIGTENQVFDFNYRDVINNRNTAQNITLRSGDVVVVP